MASPVGSSSLSSLSDYPEDDGTVEIEDEGATIDKIKRFYAQGNPLFTKAAIRKAAEALNNDVRFLDYDWNGKPWKQDVSELSSFLDPYWKDAVRVITYNCYQTFTLPSPDEHLNPKMGPLRIGLQMEQIPPECSIDDVRTVFNLYQKAWIQSSTCKNLSQILESARSTMTVNKVLCLGHGSPSFRLNYEKRPEQSHRNGELAANTQHAAALTIAQILGKPLGTEAGSDIKILAQDPEYGHLDAQFFAELGITILKDPQAFLEVDEKTFVISVACNVPQKQIIADLTRPAAMLWNTITSENEEGTAWTMKRANEIWKDVDWDEIEKSTPWRKRSDIIWNA